MASKVHLRAAFTRSSVLLSSRPSNRFVLHFRPRQPQPQENSSRYFASTTPPRLSRTIPPPIRVVEMAKSSEYILTLSCPDRPGIVHAVTGFLAQHNFNIIDSQQFGDPTTQRFFMRVNFEQPAEGSVMTVDELRVAFQETAQPMVMKYELVSAAQKPRVLIMVSKIGHCLNDLLFRQSMGQISMEVPLIISNHPDFAPLAASYKIPFHHLPITAETKAAQESKILDLVRENNIDLIVLARYMQVLSPALCSEMSGKIINIHHSFLPSFKGAKPYHQAYERGVKIVGATAHFVTSDLDEGPIIEQDIVRVDHTLSPKGLTSEGSNVESRVLATAVKWVTEKRVLLNGHKTIVFN